MKYDNGAIRDSKHFNLLGNIYFKKRLKKMTCSHFSNIIPNKEFRNYLFHLKQHYHKNKCIMEFFYYFTGRKILSFLV